MQESTSNSISLEIQAVLDDYARNPGLWYVEYPGSWTEVGYTQISLKRKLSEIELILKNRNFKKEYLLKDTRVERWLSPSCIYAEINPAESDTLYKICEELVSEIRARELAKFRNKVLKMLESQ